MLAKNILFVLVLNARAFQQLYDDIYSAKSLSDYVVHVANTDLSHLCLFYCELHLKCQSVNFSPGEKLCELNWKKIEGGNELVDRDGWVFMQPSDERICQVIDSAVSCTLVDILREHNVVDTFAIEFTRPVNTFVPPISLVVNDVTVQATLCTWFKYNTSDINGGSFNFINLHWTEDSNNCHGLRVSSGMKNFFINVHNHGIGIAANADGWRHFCIAWSVDGNQIRSNLFVMGVNTGEKEVDFQIDPVVSSVAILSIGADRIRENGCPYLGEDGMSLERQFRGSITQLYMWNVRLSGERMQRVFERNEIPQKNLIVHWSAFKEKANGVHHKELHLK